MSHVASPAAVDPVEMTWRARFYLTVCGTRHGLTGLSALLLYDKFPTVDLGLPLWGWALVFLSGSGHLLYSAYAGSEMNARIALAVSAVVTSVWAAGFFAFWMEGRGSPLGVILFGALTLKDLTIVGEPMRSPFEPIVREYAQRPDG